jgi:membrane fusion protein, copper/silver efflux system
MKKVALFLICLALISAAIFGRKKHLAAETNSAQPGRHVLYYVDPMHPAYRSPHPGVAPDCGMQLEPVYSDSNKSASRTDSQTPQNSACAAAPSDMSNGLVSIDATAQRLIGLQTVTPALSDTRRTVRVPGRVAFDETRVYKVTAGTDGWLRETFDSAIGTPVRKEQTLATFYSPEFVALEQGYLVATERMGAGSAVKQAAAQGTQSSAARLRNLGMSETQIQEISETRQMPEEIKLVSPADGVIVARNVSAGERFERGAEFYRIADLSHIWIIADVPLGEVGFLREGMVAHVLTPETGKTTQARITYILPEADSVAGTLKVRLEAENPGTLLRPGMIADVDLPTHGTNQLSISIDAVVDSGTTKRVFVARGDGAFEPRVVETGEYFGDRVEILGGLSPNDRVVASGTFLVDSESRLKAVETTRATESPRAAAQVIHSGMSPDQQQAGKARMTTDPTTDSKCGMAVDKSAAGAASNTFDFGHKRYFFCSKKCKEGFATDPRKYLSSRAAVAGRG